MESFEHDRAARAVLKPINEKISDWHLLTARLVEQLRKDASAGARQGIVEELNALLTDVAAERAALGNALEPGSVQRAANSRLTDTRQALDSVARRLQAMLDETSR